MSSSEGVRVPRLLTVRELSEATGIQAWRIYELARKGQGPPLVKIGRTLRFPADGVVRWLQEQTNQSHGQVSNA